MNPKFVQMVSDNTPKIDRRIGLGLSYHDNDEIPYFVDRLFRINSSGFPSKLKYMGFEATSPQESYRFMTRVANNNVRRYDINKNDTRLYSFNFDFDGQLIKKYIYLPFIRRHGFMYMNGVKYMVCPVMADGIITIKPTEIFVKLIKTKIWFERNDALQFKVDDTFVYGTIYYSDIHNKTAETDRMIKMKSTLVHYLCCKYGLTKALNLFGFPRDSVKMLTLEEFDQNQNQYPQDKWVVITSTGRKPPRTYLYSHYEPSQLCFVVKKQYWETVASAKSVFATLIYILSHYPNLKRMNPEIIENTEAWRSMMGETICSSTEHYSIIRDRIDKHMISLDDYVDDMVVDDFKRIGLGHITDIYKLFVYIVENFADLTSSVSMVSKSNSLYGKQLQVLQFLLFDITKAINRAYFELGNLKIAEEKKPNEKIKIEQVIKCLNNIRADTIMSIRGHGEIIVVDDPTDLPLLKMGRIVIPQEKSDTKRTANSSFSVNDPINILHESLIECGAALDMAKSDPSGHSRLNPYVRISDDYTILENPELSETIDDVRRLLYGNDVKK